LLVLDVSAQPGVASRYVRCASAVDPSRAVGQRRSDRDPSPDADATDRHLRRRTRPAL